MSEERLISLCNELNLVLRDDGHPNYVHSLQTVSAQIPSVTRAVSETATVEPGVYSRIVDDFIELSGLTFSRTLLGDDYNDGPYWYEEIGTGHIINSAQPMPITVESPLSSLRYKRVKQAREEQEELRNSWLQHLQKGFSGRGSTMWVTQKHKHKLTEGEIDISAVFIVFNAPIKNGKLFYPLAKASRDALVQRLLTDYSEQAALDMGELAHILSRAEISSHNGKDVIEKLKRNAKAFASNYPVLISGEPATGKMSVARAIHNIREYAVKQRAGVERINPAFCIVSGQELGQTRDEALRSIRKACSYQTNARAKLLAESQHGSVVIKNVHEASSIAQAVLLDLLEYKLYGGSSVRSELFYIRRAIFIGPPGLPLAARLERFSPSLFAVISPFEISVLPLRERADEIEQIANAATQRLAPVFGFATDVLLPDAAMAFVKENDWIGNLRELYGYLAKVLIGMKPSE